MSGEDPELQSIKERKLVEMMRRTRAQLQSAEKYDGKPIILSDATFSSEISKYPVLVVDFLGRMVRAVSHGRPYH
jgi:hypothetical protein